MTTLTHHAARRQAVMAPYDKMLLTRTGWICFYVPTERLTLRGLTSLSRRGPRASAVISSS
jgi:hypothetical protein